MVEHPQVIRGHPLNQSEYKQSLGILRITKKKITNIKQIVQADEEEWFELQERYREENYFPKWCKPGSIEHALELSRYALDMTRYCYNHHTSWLYNDNK
jgi:isocitrate lyase